jgi:hypothetical protein
MELHEPYEKDAQLFDQEDNQRQISLRCEPQKISVFRVPQTAKKIHLGATNQIIPSLATAGDPTVEGHGSEIAI